MRQWNAGRAARRIVDDDRLCTRAVGVVEHHYWADFADCGGAEILIPGGEQNSVLVDEIPREVIVKFSQDRIGLDERRCGVGLERGRKAGINCIAEHTGIAQEMTGGKTRRIGHR